MNEPPINPREREFRGWQPETAPSPEPILQQQQPVVSAKTKNFGVLSFILGIISLAFTLIPVSFWVLVLMLIIAIVGLIFGILARKEGARGLATAGFVINMICCILYPISFLGYYFLLTGVVDPALLGL